VDFSSIEAQNAANTTVLASILTKSEQKSTVLKRGSGLTAHPNYKLITIILLRKNYRFAFANI